MFITKDNKYEGFCQGMAVEMYIQSGPFKVLD